ncbi:carbohydrate ABC transporter permease [Sporosarcina sp. Marseille-Q4063]|uniref:carbohydrate ABC transporter permease n=1 Tax=Sporosarcina sp. Marseille-Q4063 TaxID=2810514 RepID=UPI001BAF9964|nr:carbohydrate ABC transporter permease [Sporosarcina sp. Marseille-Q4063]QUW22822.1 carbohydrate ABC transporter permease [Sporosarcina sp. Marseille-Q4063]
MKVGKILTYLALILGSIIMLFPFVWMVSTSLKSPIDIFSLDIIPENITFSNYIKVMEESLFAKWFINSLIIATVTTISVAFFDTLVGYIIAKFAFVGRGVLFILILSTLMVPTEMLIIPWYMMSSDFGWTDSYWGILFPGLMTGFGVFLMRQFMEQIPDDLLNAARIDGMNEFMIFFKIAIPQVWPALAALSIFTFLGNWNAFLWPLIVIESEALRTLPVGLSFFSSGEAESQWHLIMTGSTIAVIPLILVFILLQRHIISGITLTGMK